MAGKGALLQLAGCKYWYADYYSGGKRIRVSTRQESKVEAQRALTKLIADRDAGAPETDRTMTYADLRAGLIHNYKEKGNKSLHMRANGEETVNGLKQLDDFFGFDPDSPDLNCGPYVKNITTETGRQFVRARQAKGAGNAVINRSLACLRRMLKIAFEDRKLAYAPVIRLLKEPPPRKGVVSEKKFDELLEVLPANLRPLVCFLYWTGTRGGEALKIDWENVDLERGLILLETGETKNDEPRIIPLPSQVIGYLTDLEPKTGHVFCSTNLRKAWMKACVTVGLGTFTEVEDKPYDPRYEGLQVHDMRRSGLTGLSRSGVHPFVAMQISGHKDISVFKRYNIFDEADVKAAMRLREKAHVAALRSEKRQPASVKSSVKLLKSPHKH